jgi:metal-responsive CopG/Arc/MetJ family transcriptional regulator
MQITIRLPDEYGEKINRIAQSMGLKKSDIARLAIKEYIRKNEIAVRTTPYQKIGYLHVIAERGISDLGDRIRGNRSVTILP